MTHMLCFRFLDGLAISAGRFELPGAGVDGIAFLLLQPGDLGDAGR